MYKTGKSLLTAPTAEAFELANCDTGKQEGALVYATAETDLSSIYGFKIPSAGIYMTAILGEGTLIASVPDTVKVLDRKYAPYGLFPVNVFAMPMDVYLDGDITHVGSIFGEWTEEERNEFEANILGLNIAIFISLHDDGEATEVFDAALKLIYNQTTGEYSATALTCLSSGKLIAVMVAINIESGRFDIWAKTIMT